MLDFLLPIWNPFIIDPLMGGLRFLAGPLQEYVSPGVAGGLAIIIFTIFLRVIMLPLSLAQVKSQKATMAIQPELKALQKKFKGDREGMARAQMALYRERGVNPAAGCLPLLVQMPVLIGMYSAMLNLSTHGLTLDQVQAREIEPGRITYEARREEHPLPLNQFVLATVEVVPTTDAAITLEVPQDLASVTLDGDQLLEATRGLTLTPGQPTPNPGAPGDIPGGRAVIYLRPAGERQPDGSLDRDAPVEVGEPYLVEIEVTAPQARVDAARAVITFDPALLDVQNIEAPVIQDLAFKSGFLGLPSLGEPDLIHIGSFGLPGVLLLFMTLTSFLTTRLTTMPTDDPQQQMMMRMMTFMPLMYLFFFMATPAGLVLYWLVSNLFTIGQQFFTTGLGMLRGDLQRLTGRDLQPAWALHITPTKPVPPVENGRDTDEAEYAGATGNESHQRTPAQGQRAATTRRARTTSGKGRKRGKR